MGRKEVKDCWKSEEELQQTRNKQTGFRLRVLGPHIHSNETPKETAGNKGFYFHRRMGNKQTMKELIDSNCLPFSPKPYQTSWSDSWRNILTWLPHLSVGVCAAATCAAPVCRLAWLGLPAYKISEQIQTKRQP